MDQRKMFHGAVLALAFAAAAATPAAATPAPPSDPTGEWRVARGFATVRIVECDGQYWGVIASEQTPGIDRKNPDKALRERPTLGMPILLGMKPGRDNNEWSGSIYNAEDGRTYSGKISLLDPNTLEIKGCVLGILCGGEKWTRAAPPDADTAGRSSKPPSGPRGSGDSSQARAQVSPQTQSPAEICSGLGLSGSPH
jgi:uncharacterized protein (DUF2147 family)